MRDFIINNLEDYINNVKRLLFELYPYLHFYISRDLDVAVWVRRIDAKGTPYSGTAILLPRFYSKLSNFEDEYFKELNNRVKLASTEPERYFYCTECGTVKSKDEYGDFVMAAEYCKDCAKKDYIASMIEDSHKEGFYD